MAESKKRSNPPAGMVPCKVLKKLGPHEPGAEILMHPNDAESFARAGTVELVKGAGDADQE